MLPVSSVQTGYFQPQCRDGGLATKRMTASSHESLGLRLMLPLETDIVMHSFNSKIRYSQSLLLNLAG